MPEPLLPSTSRALLHRIATAQRDGRTPSLVGAVVRDGEQVWFGSRSMIDGHAPDADTQYRIGSISKTFTAVLVMQLRDAGRVELTDPIGRHLPGVDVGHLRIGELLAHTAGLASETAGVWWERVPGQARIADALGGDPIRHPAGRRFHYSNPGFGLLGALVEELHGEPWGAVLQRDVLDPLAMTRTSLLPQQPHAGGWAVHPWADVMLPEPAEDARAMAPAGQMWSTADDLCRWAAFLASGHDGVLSSDTVAEMREPAAPPSDDSLSASYGLGLQVVRFGDRTLVGHGGSMPGFLATVWVSVGERLAAVALTNATSGVMVGALAADLIDVVADREPPMPEPWCPLPDYDGELLALTGPWYWGPTAFGLHLAADRGLELRPRRGGSADEATRLRAEADGTWTALDGYFKGERLRVVRDSAGAVTHLDLGTFVLTRGAYDPAGPQPGGVDEGGWRGVPR